MRSISIRHTTADPEIGRTHDDQIAGALLEDFARVCALPEVFPIYIAYMKAKALETGGDPTAMDRMTPENLLGTAAGLHIGHCTPCYHDYISERQ